MRFHLIVPDTRKDRRDSFSWFARKRDLIIVHWGALVGVNKWAYNLETTQKIFFKNLVFWRLIVIVKDKYLQVSFSCEWQQQAIKHWKIEKMLPIGV